MEFKKRRHTRNRAQWTPVATSHRMGQAVHVIAEMEEANKQDVLSELVRYAIEQHPKWKRAVDEALPEIAAIDPCEIPQIDFGVVGRDGLTEEQKREALARFERASFRVADARILIAEKNAQLS